MNKIKTRSVEELEKMNLKELKKYFEKLSAKVNEYYLTVLKIVEIKKLEDMD